MGMPPRRRPSRAPRVARATARPEARARASRAISSRPSRARRPPPRRAGLPRLLLLACAGGALLWLSRGRWWPAPPPPQMILVLGGDKDREITAADLARSRGLPVVVSGGTNPEYAHWLFQERAGLPQGQVHLDYRAHDTLSNFTSLVDDLRRARIRHALLVTSSDHMPRALLVGRIVAGSRGIQLTPVAVPCGVLCAPEGRRLVWGDGLRAALWVLSGRDLRSWAEVQLGPWLPAAGWAGSAPAREGR